MQIRDAVESDAEALAADAALPTDALAQLIHDRTVVVAEADEDDGADSEDEPLGFLAFDADEGAVHVTQVHGDAEVVGELLAEPVRFAEREDMPVEVLVPESEGTVIAAVEDAGFAEGDTGPRFEGEPTRRYRLEPT